MQGIPTTIHKEYLLPYKWAGWTKKNYSQLLWKESVKTLTIEYEDFSAKCFVLYSRYKYRPQLPFTVGKEIIVNSNKVNNKPYLHLLGPKINFPKKRSETSITDRIPRVSSHVTCQTVQWVQLTPYSGKYSKQSNHYDALFSLK